MKIDYSKLTRDYKKQPIKQKEQLIYEDVYYLYWELNLTKQQVGKILGCSDMRIYKFAKQNGLIKTQEMITQSQKNLMIEKYGTDNIMKTEKAKKKLSKSMQKTFSEKKQEIVKKRKQTWIKNYGVENPSQSQEIKEKKEQTTLKNYGVNNPLKSSIIKEKINNTFKEKYGDNPLGKNSCLKKKIEKSNIEKYGYKNPMQNPEISQKTSKTLKEKQAEIIQKSLEKYGVEWPSQLPQVINQINDTKRVNGTFNTSSEEDYIFELLKNKYIQVNRQYRCKEYPFACDFYLPLQNLFIEYNGSWTHGIEPFNPENKKHLLILDKMKEKAKTSKFYKQAIYTWTDLDVRKLQCARNNNLNYLCFYNMKEFLNWFNKEIK